MNTQLPTIVEAHAEALDRFEFCRQSSDTPLVFEVVEPMAKRSIFMEGWWCPEHGHILDLLVLGWKRYFCAFRASANIGSEEDGYYRFSARMTLKNK